MSLPILILGASQELIMPDFECKEVFTCNSSAKKGKDYQDMYKSCIHTNITPAKAFNKIDEIRISILNSSPDILISRFDKIDFQSYKELKNVSYSEYTFDSQVAFQKKFLNYPIDFYRAEMKYKKKFFQKIKHFKQCITWRKFLGCSTGLFAALVALEKYKLEKIILSGIDFKGGEYFQGKRKMTEGRALVDIFFLESMKKEFKSRIFTINEQTSKRVNLKTFSK
jgi:hypothetical protein